MSEVSPWLKRLFSDIGLHLGANPISGCSDAAAKARRARLRCKYRLVCWPGCRPAVALAQGHRLDSERNAAHSHADISTRSRSMVSLRIVSFLWRG